MPQTFFNKLPLFAKIRFNPFDSVPFATLHFAIFDIAKAYCLSVLVALAFRYQ